MKTVRKTYVAPLCQPFAVQAVAHLLESSYIPVGGTGGDEEIIPPPSKGSSMEIDFASEDEG